MPDKEAQTTSFGGENWGKEMFLLPGKGRADDIMVDKDEPGGGVYELLSR
jgi:hypothetical protein